MTAGTDATAGARAALDLLRQHPLEDVIPILAALDREQRLETIAGVLAAGDRSPLAGAILRRTFPIGESAHDTLMGRGRRVRDRPAARGPSG